MKDICDLVCFQTQCHWCSIISAGARERFFSLAGQALPFLSFSLLSFPLFSLSTHSLRSRPSTPYPFLTIPLPLLPLHVLYPLPSLPSEVGPWKCIICITNTTVGETTALHAKYVPAPCTSVMNMLLSFFLPGENPRWFKNYKSLQRFQSINKSIIILSEQMQEHCSHCTSIWGDITCREMTVKKGKF